MSTTKKKATTRKKATKKVSKAKPVIVTPQEALSTSDEAAAAAAEILGKADQQVLSQAEDRLIGASPEHSASHNPSQRDFIPGTAVIDPTYIPERCYDEIAQQDRAVALKNDYHYVWVTDNKINQFKIKGYRFVLYDGGSQSGLAAGGLRGTYLFERTIDNHVRNGDVFLMWCPLRLWEELVAYDQEQGQRWEQAAENDHHNLGYRHGVRTFKEVDGKQIFN
jgi:hypothetical protein